MTFIRRFFWPLVVVLGILLLALAFEGGRYTVYSTHPDLSGQDKAGKVLTSVGKHIQLPQNEKPTMATINDANAAKQGQPFLSAAQNGDVLIVYPTTGEALLYRPSTDKLIAVGPVENGSSQRPVVQPPAPAATSTNVSTSTTKK